MLSSVGRVTKRVDIRGREAREGHFGDLSLTWRADEREKEKTKICLLSLSLAAAAWEKLHARPFSVATRTLAPDRILRAHAAAGDHSGAPRLASAVG